MTEMNKDAYNQFVEQANTVGCSWLIIEDTDENPTELKVTCIKRHTELPFIKIIGVTLKSKVEERNKSFSTMTALLRGYESADNFTTAPDLTDLTMSLDLNFSCKKIPNEDYVEYSAENHEEKVRLQATCATAEEAKARLYSMLMAYKEHLNTDV